jgi:hypothetical protein
MDIKKGTSFRVAFQFETDAEWTSLFPADYALSQIRFGDDLFDLEVMVDTLSRTIYLKGDTELWPLGSGAFDIKVIAGDLIQTIPELTNIEVNVVEGITE